MLPSRVLQIGKHFHPDVGGIETVTKNVSDALAMVGIRADVLCMALHSSGDRQEAGYHVMRSRSNAVLAGNKTLSWEYVRRIGQLSAAYDLGILHVPNPLGAVAVMVRWRKPLIVLWHADFAHPMLSRLTNPLDIALARRADAIVAATEVHLNASNRARYLVPKGEVIPYPFQPRPTTKSGKPSALVERIRQSAGGRPIVLAAGRLVPYKGFDVLIRAMGLIDEGLYCVIAGGGPMKDELERQIGASGVGHKVTLTGQIADDDMAGLVELAHFGCLPSVTAQEMYGLTQVEMMAAGKPVVSTNLAGSGVPLVNRHGETGLLARPSDAVDLARQLAVLVTDHSQYHHLAEGAARAFRNEYSLHSVGERYAALIERLTGGR